MTVAIIKDSISGNANRLTTIKAAFPWVVYPAVTRHPDIMVTLRWYTGNVSRLPNGPVEVLMTSNAWVNVLTDFQYETADAVRAMADVINTELFKSVPDVVEDCEWHLPFVDQEDVEPALRAVVNSARRLGLMLNDPTATTTRILARVSAVRCALMTPPGTDRFSGLADALETFTGMTYDKPGRTEYLDHQLIADPTNTNMPLHGRAPGWVSHRKLNALDKTGGE